jgi:hypothetical protein
MTTKKDTKTAQGHALPWSFKLPMGWKVVVSCLSAIIVVFIGSAISRSGAAYGVPWGLVVALVLIFASSWSARARGGFVCVLCHFLVSWVCAVVLMGFFGFGPGEEYPLLLGSVAGANFLMQYGVYLWLGGFTIIQIVMAFLPKQFFSLEVHKK